MKIFATGDAKRLKELTEKIGPSHSLDVMEEDRVNDAHQSDYDLLFDLNLDDQPHRLRNDSFPEKKIIIVSAVKTSLTQLKYNYGTELPFTLIGINALPTFIQRSKVEVSFLHADDEKKFSVIAKELGWDYLAVEDRVGMVTPRVITMIINEACFTLQEGTAKKEDIDKGMKLGTNYPFGPFEWCDRIGVKDVYETLEAIWNDTHDERYKICPLLKSKYLKNESFY